MKQLNGFYELDGTLLYASQDICAFDPLISEPIPRVKTEYGEKTSTTTLQLGELDLLIEFKSELHGGPLRGREGIRIYHGEQLLIDRATGSMGHGSSFTTGKSWYIGPDYFLLLSSNGYELDYKLSKERYRNLPESSTYLFLFKNYSIPTLLPVRVPQTVAAKHPLEKILSFEEEIEGLREDIWKTELAIADGPLSLVHSRVNGYSFYSNTGKRVLYEPSPSHYCRRKTIMIFKGEHLEVSSPI